MPGKGEQKVTLTLEELKADHPELVEEIRNEGYAAGAEEASAVVANKDKEIATLKSTVEAQKQENADLNDRVVSLEKKDAPRDEQDMKNTAEALVTTKLNASSLTPRQHSKVRKQFNHERFIKDGALDQVAFSEHVDAEISDWEETIAESSSPIHGIGSASRDKIVPDEETTASDDAVADELIALGSK